METAEAIELHDRLLASQPEGAQHNADICPICVDKATETANPPSRIPPGSAGPDVSDSNTSQTTTEGGTPKIMTDISQEAHDALVAAAVAKATEATDKALAAKNDEVAELTKKNEELEADNAKLKADNDRLNADLDAAQVSLRAEQEKVTTLEADKAKMAEDAELAKKASDRAEQVRNLDLFPAEYVTDDKASSWAKLSDEDWAERIDELKQLKPAGTPGEAAADTASALSGTTESLTKEPEGDKASETDKPAPRRAVLGLR